MTPPASLVKRQTLSWVQKFIAQKKAPICPWASPVLQRAKRVQGAGLYIHVSRATDLVDLGRDLGVECRRMGFNNVEDQSKVKESESA